MMKKIDKKRKESRPWRPLVPVLLLLAADLGIYLYFIAINVKNLNFWPLTQENTMNVLLIASYFFTTIAMLLTLTSYFAVKASVKAIQTIPQENAVLKESTVDALDFIRSENIPTPAIENLPKIIEAEKPVIPLVTENKPEEKHIPIIETPPIISEENEKPVKIIEYSGGVESKWKKIGVKLTDEAPTEPATPIELIQEQKTPSTNGTSPQNVEIQAETKNEATIEPIKEVSNEIITGKEEKTPESMEISDTPKEALIEAKAIDLPSEPHIVTPPEAIPVEEPFIEVELIDEPLIEEPIEDDSDSEVLRDLKELKLMVEEMKKKVELRKIKNT